ncbi:MAG: phosphonate ABC transporter, permease protein PhnE [Euryarchaeota archaeon]|nr:phosphonate ABC transporter, permease protein PhnE [Euryarchaeota archaeon]|tara:strand:+ start:1636 stop:2592 length:957 start_codon:yes stop_codon:yes gene_type:complete
MRDSKPQSTALNSALEVVKRYQILLFVVLLAFYAVVVMNGLIDGKWGRLAGGWENLRIFFAESLPPDWSVLEARSYPECNQSIGFFCSIAYLGMLETIKIAFVATIFGFIGAILLSSLAARNLVPFWVSIIIRILLSAMRSLPSLIWAILFVIIFGLGPLAGVLAMTFYTIGYLGKLQYEAIEGMDSAPLEASRATGLTRPEILTNVVIPETSNHLLSQLMFMFEYNVRHGTVIGIVGAGGIGYYISNYLNLFLYDKVFALLLVTFIVVVLIDMISMAVRSFVNEDGDVRRPSWLTVFFSPNRAVRYHKVRSDVEGED